MLASGLVSPSCHTNFFLASISLVYRPLCPQPVRGGGLSQLSTTTSLPKQLRLRISCRGGIRTRDLLVMSQTSLPLLYPAMMISVRVNAHRTLIRGGFDDCVLIELTAAAVRLTRCQSPVTESGVCVRLKCSDCLLLLNNYGVNVFEITAVIRLVHRRSDNRL